MYKMAVFGVVHTAYPTACQSLTIEFWDFRLGTHRVGKPQAFWKLACAAEDPIVPSVLTTISPPNKVIELTATRTVFAFSVGKHIHFDLHALSVAEAHLILVRP